MGRESGENHLFKGESPKGVAIVVQEKGSNLESELKRRKEKNQVLQLRSQLYDAAQRERKEEQ